MVTTLNSEQQRSQQRALVGLRRQRDFDCKSQNFDNGPGPHIIITGNTSVNNAELVPEYRANAITDGEGIILDSNQGYTGGFLVENNTTSESSGPGIVVSFQ